MTTTDQMSNEETAPAGTGDVVLEVSDLSVTFPSDDGPLPAVREVSYVLRRGEALGIVGESGSGKSVTSMAIMGLLPKNARVEGSAKVLGQEVIGLKDAQISKVRGNKIAMIFQDPLTSLNPVYTVGYQIAEAVLAHRKVGKKAAMARALELLELVGIPSPEQRIKQYPHELSGGMRQRVVIAIAMANEPDVIIADEPTTALDVTVQAQVLEALEAARKETGAALVLITHDLGVVAGHVDRIGVMYGGRLVEMGPVEEVFYRPRMPYALGLLGSLPRLDEDRHERLTPIVGTPPSLLSLPTGCAFSPRCPMARDLCREQEPLLLAVGGDGERVRVPVTDTSAHTAACHFSEELGGAAPADLFRGTAVEAETVTEVEEAEKQAQEARAQIGAETAAPADGGPREAILTVKDLVKNFPIRSKGLLRRRIGEVQAVSGVSLELREHETLALVGESGCGKSTTARLMLQLIRQTSGEVSYMGQPLHTLSPRQMRPLRRDLQLVFQDPFASLDPRMTVSDIIAEPLRIHGQGNGTAKKRVRELLDLVGLNAEHGSRYPHEFSGGQRQRIGIARALALNPKVLILDEPVSALDVSIQAGVINLLEDLQDDLGLSYLFVSHDLSVVKHIADRVAVMYLGKIVETGTTAELFGAPSHPYTQALISAIPLPDPVKERTRERIVVTGDVPSPADPPSGCRFRTRCPKFANELSEGERAKCVEEPPELMDRGAGHLDACHYSRARELF
ncbi:MULTISPECIES: ABC transporter ATP-binding protein [Nocardiopsis]|uniref:Oligopeptide/dipeptide ABC transporter, ATPase subunit n=3 Tax=Nocardiopsis TaxID=2013 RepID=D7AY41_NOCDD|nr:ABC transporter ATP-binding protein [Nocardiopsis dassonvillei]ADH69919.1 oligopeptide/dipeptide ABC transporter, ATPase subunit [Nocardiopsis dassonvillei subsp. dassonvillei DSM 43111]APC37904.1 glutathione ABC transporter ATP-binding protein [Nocardiopsis dassonvillei]VEI90432.1 Glutathione import ATP-binding protein GsiA [Nocardiopsis dassonvillei]